MPDRETEEQAIAYAKALTTNTISEARLDLASETLHLDQWDDQDEFEAKYQEAEAEYQRAISGPVTEIKNLSDDMLISIWERREQVDPAIVRAAAHELERSFPGFHATPALWHKLATEQNYEVAASSFERQGRAADYSKLSDEQIIAGLWRAANAPLTEKELAIKERAAALAETKTPEPTLDVERQRRHQRRI
jgi:hypothetical protein